ncbi:ROK family protein [bacterium]|nr:MAG: ROK family protein [bacterium]
MAKDYCVGVDLGATNIKIGLLRNRRIISKKVLPTQSFTSQKNLIEGICRNIRQGVSEAGMAMADISGIGIGLPGPVDSKRGIVHFFPNIRGWRKVALREIMRKKMRLPVTIDNDANVMTLAEARIGAARGKRNVVGLTLGTGVGGGIVVDGNLYRGSSLAAGEIGHIPLNERGPKCNCGGKACLERYIGNRYLLENARKAFGPAITLEALSRLASRGNRKAIAVWKEMAGHLGVALSGVINFFNPDTVVIGGGVANAGRIIIDQVRRVVKERAMPTQARTVKIVRARLGSDAGMIGAGILLQEELSKNAG